MGALRCSRPCIPRCQRPPSSRCGYITADSSPRRWPAAITASAGACSSQRASSWPSSPYLVCGRDQMGHHRHYKPIMKPMWSFWAMRTEMVAVLYGGLVGKASSRIPARHAVPALDPASLYGFKIGKGVWMDLTDVTEFDCVKIGDYATPQHDGLSADASIRGPHHEGRPRRSRQGRVGRLGCDGALRYACRRLCAKIAPLHRGDEGREHPRPQRLGRRTRTASQGDHPNKRPLRRSSKPSRKLPWLLEPQLAKPRRPGARARPFR